MTDNNHETADRLIHHVLGEFDRRATESERRTAENETSISELRTNISEIGAQLSAHGSVLQQIATKVNTPSTFNVWAAISAIVALAVMGAGFVALNTMPLNSDISELQTSVVRDQEWRMEEQYNQGRQDAFIEILGDRVEVLERQLNEHE
jgi:cytoskeletal protein RodZ